MSNNLDTIKIRHIDKLMLKKYIRADFLEKNPNVSDSTFPELIDFLIKYYLGINYDKLKSELENELNIKHIKPHK